MLKQHSLKRVLRSLEKMDDVNAPLQTDFNFRQLTEREKKSFRKRAQQSPWRVKRDHLINQSKPQALSPEAAPEAAPAARRFIRKSKIS